MAKGNLPMSEKRTNEDERSNKTRRIIQQIMAVISPLSGTLSVGLTSGYSAILLPQLMERTTTNENSTFVRMTDYLNMAPLTTTGIEQESWVAASAALAMAPGSWMAGVLMEKFGRRAACLITSPIFVIAWFMIGLAPNMPCLIIGRFLCGLCSGFNGPLGPVSIAETSEPDLRGIFLASLSTAVALGIMLSHIFGTWLHWRISALLCAIFPALCFIFGAIGPETPTWLVKKKKFVSAHKVWIRLRGEYCEQEFDALRWGNMRREGTIGEKNPEKSPEMSSLQNNIDENSSSSNEWKTVVRSSSFMMPLLVISVYFFISQFSGSIAIVFYSIQMLGDIAGGEYAYIATLILDSIRIVFGILACWLTSHYRRRSLMMASGIGTISCLLLLSGCLSMDLGKPWLPILLLFVYMCFVSIGLVPLPWLLCGELFATSVRGLGSGLTCSFAFIFFFLVVKSAPGMIVELGPSWTFATYGTIVLAGTIFLYCFLPETKGKTLNEIGECYTSPKKNSPKVQASQYIGI